MPTPVSIAKQCLNSEASRALDEAVALTRRRGHAQTTSLHAVSAFLSLSPSQLKEACVRARNSAFYPRVQLKALDFCLSVSLDRLPTSQNPVDEPPVSNSLMAAIKRSQANQRRQPESFMTVKNVQNQHLGQCQNQQLGTTSTSSLCSGSSSIKVELQPLIVSILDDPIVSRVFNDAGFRSFDVKLALLRPFQSFFRYPSRVRGQHQGVLFGNLDGHLDPGFRPFRFPFSGNWGSLDGGEDYRRRIGEVLVRKKGRNPLLVGVGANDALKGFLEVLERKEFDVLPLELQGINVVSIEKDVMKFVSENWSDEAIRMRCREVELMLEHLLGPGLMVSLGNLRCFLSGDNGFGMDVLNSVVRNLTKLLEVHGCRVWLIGSAPNDQIYMEFLSRYPSINKDWDLQLVPITSVKPSIGESCFKSSLMSSFVPFGGFFSPPPDLEGYFGGSYQGFTRCNLCKEKCELEVAAMSKQGFVVSATDQHQSALSPWLQMTAVGTNSTLDPLKAKGGTMFVSGIVAGLHRKWDNVCQHLHHTRSMAKQEDFQERFHHQSATCFQYFEEKEQNVNKESTSTSNSFYKECELGKISSCTSVDKPGHSTFQSSNPVFQRKNDSFLAKLLKSPSKTECPHLSGSSTPRSLRSSDGDDRQHSPPGVSVATNLELRLFSQPYKRQTKASSDLDCKNHVVMFESHALFSFAGKSDANDVKTLFKALFERVGRQCEAVRTISQIIACSRTSDGRHQRSGLRGDIWLNLIGPDVFGKRRAALALAEVLYGSNNNFIHVDLCSKDGVFLRKNGFGSGCDVRHRGKTVVDQIAEELLKKPFCVVLLENVQSADPLVKRSLLHAISNGRFPDSHGREVTINNRTFFLTSRRAEDYSIFSAEERITRAKGWPLQILVKHVGNHTTNPSSALITTGQNILNHTFLDKRKLHSSDVATQKCVNVDQVKRPNRGSSFSLDLNLPAEVSEDDSTKSGDIEGGYGHERFESWLEESSNQVNKILAKVVFEPIDYDSLATKISKLVYDNFYKIVGFNCSLEIEPRVMDQILAASCLSEGDKGIEDWIEQVLSKGFSEANRRYKLTEHSVVILATCEGLYAEEQALEACLPSKIILV